MRTRIIVCVRGAGRTQIADADRLRRAIGNCFERASYPTMTDEERRRTLTFVVVGAGPTGVGPYRIPALLGPRSCTHLRRGWAAGGCARAMDFNIATGVMRSDGHGHDAQ